MWIVWRRSGTEAGLQVWSDPYVSDGNHWLSSRSAASETVSLLEIGACVQIHCQTSAQEI